MRSGDSATFTEQARRAQIVAAAIEVIAKGGYPQASLAKIAEHIGVAKSVVLYHFKTKSDIMEAIVNDVFARGAAVIVPAITEHSSAAGKLAAYIRSNIAFIDSDHTAAIAVLEIVTSYRTSDGLNFNEAAAKATQENPPVGALALLDPQTIFEEGVRTGEFNSLSPEFMKNALRGALDGAVWSLSRDPDYNLVGYGEELVEIFDRATRSSR
jgi:AcrR family transcriptional regulator